MDITQLILDDHHEQRRLFAILEQVDRSDTKALGGIWARLSAFLEVHAEAEERHFYPSLLRVGTGAGGKASADAETEDAIKDHNEIRDAIAEAATHEPGSAEWWKAVRSCEEENSDHMAEEEREDLVDFRQHADLQTRHDIAVQFIVYENQNAARGIPLENEDPKQYVAENG